MNAVKLTYPGHPLTGIVRLPASKSISNRLLLMQALSGQTFQIENLSEAGDTEVMQNALKGLTDGNREIDVRDAGTVARFVAAYMALNEIPGTMTGTPALCQRPMAPLIDSLRSLGARIVCTGKEGFLPLRFEGGTLKGTFVRVDTTQSSQFLSALLMIAPYLPEGLHITISEGTISEPYITMTLRLMEELGVDVDKQGNLIRVPKSFYGSRKPLRVEPDWSSAAPWFSMCVLQDSSSFCFPGLLPDSLQGDRRVTDVFGLMGVVSVFDQGTLVIRGGGAVDGNLIFDFSATPDLAQCAIVAAAGRGLRGRFTGLQTLRYKETDRYTALRTELLKMGMATSGTPFVSMNTGMAPLLPQDQYIETYLDHRMALAFAPLVLLTNILNLKNPEVVRKSYPQFWEDLRKIGIQTEEYSL